MSEVLSQKEIDKLLYEVEDDNEIDPLKDLLEEPTYIEIGTLAANTSSDKVTSSPPGSTIRVPTEWVAQRCPRCRVSSFSFDEKCRLCGRRICSKS